MKKININEKFGLFSEQWTPKILAESNGQLVKIAKGSGELVWHKHDNEDELFIVFKGELTLKLPEQEVVLKPGEMFVVPKGVEFIVFKGELTLKLPEQEVVLKPGEMFVVPKGVEHCPVAEPDTHFMMIEPSTTAHTGELKAILPYRLKNKSGYSAIN